MVLAPRVDSNEAIGKRLRLIRIAYGRLQGFKKEMTQAEIARRLGKERQDWHNAESGYSRIGLDFALAIFHKIGADLMFIYKDNRLLLPAALSAEIEKIEQEDAAKAKEPAPLARKRR